MQGIRYAPAIMFLLGHLLQIGFSIFAGYQYQLRCPTNEKEWEERSKRYNCYDDGVYHCMQDQEGKYVTFCGTRIRIQQDYCPEFKTNFSVIGVTLCPGALNGCPEKSFMSNEIYKYPSCFRTVMRSTVSCNDKQTTNPWLFVLIVLVIILSIIAIIFLVLLLRRRRSSRMNELNRRYPEETEEGTGFLKDMENTATTKPCEDTEDNTVIDQKNVSEEVQRKNVEPNEKFVKPEIYSEAVEKVKREGYVVFYGVTGSGKSTLAQYIVKNEFPEYNLVHLRGKQKETPTFSSDVGILLWDDCFGIWNINNDENEDVILKYVKGIIDKCRRNPQTHKAVLCFDSFFFGVKHFRDYIANTMDLHQNYASQIRKEIFRNEMTHNKRYSIPPVSEEVGFPLLISLILEHPYLEEKKDDFLKHPIPILHDRYQNLLKEDPDEYVTLIYVVCNCPVNLKEVSKEKWDILKKECEKAGNCEPGKEQNNGDKEKDIYPHESRKYAKNKGNSKMSGETNKVAIRGVLKRGKVIEVNETLGKYLVKNESQEAQFEFRHQFLAETLLRFHVNHFGKKGVSKAANDEVAFVLKKL